MPTSSRPFILDIVALAKALDPYVKALDAFVLEHGPTVAAYAQRLAEVQRIEAERLTPYVPIATVRKRR